VDGKEIGESPTFVELEVGKVHKITAEKEGYTPSTVFVNPVKDKTVFVNIKLSLKPEEVSISLPSNMFVGERAGISAKAVYSNKVVNLTQNNSKIEVHGDAIKLQGDEIIAVKPGKSLIRVEYHGIIKKKIITVLPTNSISISVGSTMMGEFGISTTYNTKLFFVSAGYYITPSLISVEGGVKLSLWILETKLGASYFVGAANPFGIFTEMGIKLAMVEPYVKIIVPVGFIGAVDGIPAILYGGVSLNIGF